MTKWETWTIEKQEKDNCFWLDYDWCTYHKKKCSFKLCHLSVRNSHKYIDTYGRTVEMITDEI